MFFDWDLDKSCPNGQRRDKRQSLSDSGFCFRIFLGQHLLQINAMTGETFNGYQILLSLLIVFWANGFLFCRTTIGSCHDLPLTRLQLTRLQLANDILSIINKI